MEESKKIKFYQKTWFLWVMLIFFTPVGIALLWIQNRYKKNARIILSIVFSLYFVLVLLSNDSEDIQEPRISNYNIENNQNVSIDENSKTVQEKLSSKELENEETTENIELTMNEKFERDLVEQISNNGELINIDWEGDYGTGEKYIIIDLKTMNDEAVVNEQVNLIKQLLEKYEINQKVDIVVKDISNDINSNLAIINIDETKNIKIEFESSLYNTLHNQWINDQFSVWDGSHKVLKELIIKSLNDEKSYKHIETKYRTIKTQEDKVEINKILEEAGYSTRVEIKDLYITQEFSAKNAFNATIKNTGIGVASYENNQVTLIDILY